MLIFNSIRVLLRNMISRLATNSRKLGVAAVTLGYGYDIEDDED